MKRQNMKHLSHKKSEIRFHPFKTMGNTFHVLIKLYITMKAECQNVVKGLRFDPQIKCVLDNDTNRLSKD